MNRIKNYPLLFTTLPVLLGILLIYLPDLKNGFVWDDSTSFFSNPMYRDPANIQKALTGALIYQQNYFRPLPVLSFLIQIHVFEISAAQMHLVSILLHVFNTFMVMLIAVKFLRDLDKPRVYLSAALAGLIYGLHPALIEPVSFISSRFDMMLTAFLLTAIYADIRISNQWWRAFAVGLLFLLAALCKEMAVGFAIALPVWHFLKSGAKWPGLRSYIKDAGQQGEIKVYIAVVIAGFVYLVLRSLALGIVFDSSFYHHDTTHLALSAHLALIGVSVFKYLSLLFFPLGKISVAHPLPENLEFGNPEALLGYAFLILAPAIAWFGGKQRLMIIAGFAMVLAGLLPILGLIPLPRNPAAFFSESFLPFPAALLALVLIRPLNSLVNFNHAGSRGTKLALGTLLGFWLLLSAFTVTTTIPIWKSDMTLWAWARATNPGNDEVRLNLAHAYLSEHRYAQAIDELNKLVPKYGDTDVVWNYLSYGLVGLGRYNEAKEAAEHALQLNPSETRNKLALAQIEYQLENYPAAESLLGSVLDKNPQEIPAIILLANVYKKTNRLANAEQDMRKAISKLPLGRNRRLLQAWLQDLDSGK